MHTHTHTYAGHLPSSTVNSHPHTKHTHAHSGPLGLVAEKQLLKEHGVEKTYHLRSEPIDTDQRRMVFLVRDSIPNMKAIASQVCVNDSVREIDR